MSAGEEIVADALDESRRAASGWEGVIPMRLVNVEQHRVMVGGRVEMQAVVTFDAIGRDKSLQVSISPEDAAAAARMLAPIGDHAWSGLFVVGD